MARPTEPATGPRAPRAPPVRVSRAKLPQSNFLRDWDCFHTLVTAPATAPPAMKQPTLPAPAVGGEASGRNQRAGDEPADLGLMLLDESSDVLPRVAEPVTTARISPGDRVVAGVHVGVELRRSARGELRVHAEERAGARVVVTGAEKREPGRVRGGAEEPPTGDGAGLSGTRGTERIGADPLHRGGPVGVVHRRQRCAVRVGDDRGHPGQALAGAGSHSASGEGVPACRGHLVTARPDLLPTREEHGGASVVDPDQAGAVGVVDVRDVRPTPGDGSQFAFGVPRLSLLLRVDGAAGLVAGRVPREPGRDRRAPAGPGHRGQLVRTGGAFPVRVLGERGGAGGVVRLGEPVAERVIGVLGPVRRDTTQVGGSNGAACTVGLWVSPGDIAEPDNFRHGRTNRARTLPKIVLTQKQK